MSLPENGAMDGDRTDPGHHLALRQVTVADDALVAVRGLQIGMLAEKVRDLGLDCLGQQSTRAITQDFGELIVGLSWLNQLDRDRGSGFPQKQALWGNRRYWPAVRAWLDRQYIGSRLSPR
jgi:hypothetical protein